MYASDFTKVSLSATLIKAGSLNLKSWAGSDPETMAMRVPSGRVATRIIILTILMLAFSAAPAYAAFGDGGYYDWSVVSTWTGNAGATSPHGAYSTSTVKCGVPRTNEA